MTGVPVTPARASGQEGGKERARRRGGARQAGLVQSQLMGAREPGFVAVGQPCVMVRDRILTCRGR